MYLVTCWAVNVIKYITVEACDQKGCTHGCCVSSHWSSLVGYQTTNIELQYSLRDRCLHVGWCLHHTHVHKLQKEFYSFSRLISPKGWTFKSFTFLYCKSLIPVTLFMCIKQKCFSIYLQCTSVEVFVLHTTALWSTLNLFLVYCILCCYMLSLMAPIGAAFFDIYNGNKGFFILFTFQCSVLPGDRTHDLKVIQKPISLPPSSSPWSCCWRAIQAGRPCWGFLPRKRNHRSRAWCSPPVCILLLWGYRPQISSPGSKREHRGEEIHTHTPFISFKIQPSSQVHYQEYGCL